MHLISKENTLHVLVDDQEVLKTYSDKSFCSEQEEVDKDKSNSKSRENEDIITIYEGRNNSVGEDNLQNKSTGENEQKEKEYCNVCLDEVDNYSYTIL